MNTNAAHQPGEALPATQIYYVKGLRVMAKPQLGVTLPDPGTLAQVVRFDKLRLSVQL